MQIVLNVSNLGDIEIPVPPMDLQKKIIDLIGSTEEQYQLNIKIADTYKTISNQLLEDMLGL
jgi:restriction endonuclease S subunit